MNHSVNHNVVSTHLAKLQRQFADQFQESTEEYNWIWTPLDADITTASHRSMAPQEKLIELSSDRTLQFSYSSQQNIC